MTSTCNDKKKSRNIVFPCGVLLFVAFSQSKSPQVILFCSESMMLCCGGTVNLASVHSILFSAPSVNFHELRKIMTSACNGGGDVTCTCVLCSHA